MCSLPIDALDPELIKYTTPNLKETNTLVCDNGGKKLGYHKTLEHEKRPVESALYTIELPPPPIELPPTEEPPTELKQEFDFDDYDDNITLDEFRNTTEKSDETLEEQPVKEEEETKKKRKTKKKEQPKTKRKKSKESVEGEEPKTSIRKTVELDPSKIRIVTLNPEEQFKQSEEESKAKFPYQCHLCYKGFNFDTKLENHMRKHSPSRGPFSCALCTMYFPSAYSRGVHAHIHTRRYECVACGRRMTDRASILDHYRNQHEGLVSHFTCHLCGKVSNNSKTHRGHMRNHHGGQRPECEQCGKTFVNKDSLEEHRQITNKLIADHNGIALTQQDSLLQPLRQEVTELKIKVALLESKLDEYDRQLQELRNLRGNPSLHEIIPLTSAQGASSLAVTSTPKVAPSGTGGLRTRLQSGTTNRVIPDDRASEGLVEHADVYHPPLEITVTPVQPGGAITVEPSNINPITDWNFSKADFPMLYDRVSKVDWSPVLAEKCVNGAVERLYELLKAFDQVDNDILLEKLSVVGFDPSLLKLFASYLKDPYLQGTLGYNALATRRLFDQLVTVLRILRGLLDCPELVGEACRVFVPDGRARFRADRLRLFAVPPARTVSRRNSPFRVRTQIKYHQLKHTDVKEYYCVECDVRFKSAHSLRQHLVKSLKHKDKQSLKFACTRCDKRFECARALASHHAVQHDGLRAHACGACPAALASRASLAKHRRHVHQGARPAKRHICDACGKAFRGKSVLINHVRTHTGEKPFSCPTCGRKFSQATAMRTHVDLVHLKRRRGKAKQEPPAEPEAPKLDLFTKEEPQIVFDAWRQNMPNCEVYFTVTAGP
ncbi:uncharacterized protein LOC125239539 [Leguminivora glycinivorella]|uniref:uncharacterized protein LOC125239539 n=1 Tax=Leguminivora glycinivorella TaxID=1035111 RepID=UPI00200D1F5A|nr:uncharacterized protein LOC125239539 [Leguminivora glycinivorella]